MKSPSAATTNARTLGLFRHPRGIVARVSLQDAEGTWRLEWSPLERLEDPGVRPVAQAWERLGNVGEPDASVRADVLQVLEGTLVRRADISHDTPRFRAPLVPPQARATAAHPRAWRGTLATPPKASRPKWGDVRLWLCDPRSLAAVLESVGLDGHVHPYLRGHHGVDAADEWALLPDGFSEDLLPALRGLTWRDVRGALGLFHALDLQDQEPLRAALARVLLEGGPATSWLECLAARSPECRLPLVRYALRVASDAPDQEARRRALEPLDEEVLKVADASQGESYHLDLAFLTSCRALSPSYVAAGLRLQRLCGMRPLGHNVPLDCPDYPAEAVETLGDWLLVECDMERTPYILFRVWAACGELAGFARRLTSTDWRRFGPHVARAWLDTYTSCTWGGCELRGHARVHGPWEALRLLHPRIEEALERIPESHRVRFLDLIGPFLALATRDELARRDPRAAVALAERISRPPFPIQGTDAEPVQCLLDVDGRFLSISDRALAHVLHEGRRENDACMLAHGLPTLLREAPGLSWSALEAYPRRFLGLARLLGGFSLPQQREIVREALAHPLMAPAPDASLAAWVLERLPRGVPSPLTRKFEQHEDGSRPLGPVACEKARQDVLQRLVLARVATVEVLVRGMLEQGVGLSPEDEASMHALRLLRQISTNRRALRSLLRAVAAGHDDYVWTHPLTRRWLKAHPELDESLWRHGIVSSLDHPRHGRVVLAIEQRPLEVMRLGTYAGTCFGLGGCNAESAAATVLDANKRVVYARGPDGTVLARQVIALADDGRLVFQSVYPVKSDAAVRKAFGAYDRAFANALGLESCSDLDFVVSMLLSNDWWDDLPWHWGERPLSLPSSSRAPQA